MFKTALITNTIKAMDVMRKDEGGNGGVIMNISSVAAFFQDSAYPIYFATKSAVLQFSNCVGVSNFHTFIIPMILQVLLSII